MADLYDRIDTGQMASIKGRKTIYLYCASFGGGSGPLWAIKGLEAQFTTRENWSYRGAVRRKVSPSVVVLELGDGRTEQIPVGEIRRYDQFHLPAERRFNFDNLDVVLFSEKGSREGGQRV